jgi:TonB family protein
VIRQKHIFLIAIVCSLALHLASFGVYVEYAHLRGLGASATRSTSDARPTTAPADELIVYPEMGDDQGNGIGSNSSPGDEPMQAREADEDQALLSRNPTGMGRVNLPPTLQRGPVGNGKGGPPAAPTPIKQVPAPVVPAQAVAATHSHEEKPSTPEAVATPAPEPMPAAGSRVQVASALDLPKATDGQIAQVENAKTIDDPKPSVVAVAPEKKITANAAHRDVASQPLARDAVASAKPQAADGDGKQPGVPLPAGNPLPQSDSESDPFSRISGNITVPRVGRLNPRLGRKVKTTRPQVNIAGELDLFALNNPTVVLEVHIAPTGKVTDVKIAHTSGSNAIDEPTRVAVYDWWFEPAKDKLGKPVSDVIFFTVQFL